MDLTRRAGVLLHPTSLPGPYGQGDLGPEARAFVKALAEGGQAVWQMLPLGPPGYGGSPYAASSAFAGNTLLVSPELLVEGGLLEAADLRGAPRFPEGRVSHEAEGWRRDLLRRARARFDADAGADARAAFERFQEANSYWLPAHTLFTALKHAYGGGAFWAAWPEELARHLPPALRRARDELQDPVRDEAFAQFLFHDQWQALRRFALLHGVAILGDLPIFVARDSADVWARPELFELDGEGAPTVVAGVPPDVFTEDGQLWGNPLYDWKVHARTAYAWWIERLRHDLRRTDLVRIDHFRGFASTWEIPAEAPTAREGRWVEGPGLRLFAALRRTLGELPVVAEDLGYITDDVRELLRDTGFPGMKILQFAFGEDDPEHEFLPENHTVECVAYTGTHDNETTAGWFAGLEPEERARVVARTGEDDPVRGMIELAYGSPAFLAVIPAQDVLGLGNEARMNSPGRPEGNWTWRLAPGELEAVAGLRALTERHARRVVERPAHEASGA